MEMYESECDSCTDLCGCEEGTRCREWLYQGERYTEAPVPMIAVVEAQPEKEDVRQDVFMLMQKTPGNVTFQVFFNDRVLRTFLESDERFNLRCHNLN